MGTPDLCWVNAYRMHRSLLRRRELVRGAPTGEPTNLGYFVGKFFWGDDQQQAAKPYLLMSARSPVDKLNRELSGALLRDHGTDFGKSAPQELLPEKK